MVIEEESGSNVERNENVDGVMLVRSQYKEYAEHIHDPR